VPAQSANQISIEGGENLKLVHFGLSIACAGALALTQTAGAQTSGQTSQGSYGQQQAGMQLSKADKDFLKESAEASISAIKSGQLAQQKATDPNVKRFAQQQVQTHQNLYNQLNQIARQHNMTLPSQMSSRDQREYDKLSGKSGNEFDREYTQWSADHSQKAVQEFQKEAEHGQNPDVKNLAASYLPTMQNQMQTAQGLERSSAAAGQMDGTTPRSDQQDQPDQD